MLLRFGVENHLSIRERQELLLTAAKRVKRSDPAVPVPILREAAVPVAILYGANAAGKSNLIHAIRRCGRYHIVMSHKSEGRGGSTSRETPSCLTTAARTSRRGSTACSRSMAATPAHRRSLRVRLLLYGRRVHGRVAAPDRANRKRQTTQVLFHRTTEDGNVQVSFGGRLRGENRAIASLTRPNSLFLSAAAQNNHPQLGAIHRQFVEQWQLGPRVRLLLYEHQLAEMFARLENQDAFMELMHQADLGVVGAELEDYEIPEAEREKFREFQRALNKLTGLTNEGDELPLNRKRLQLTHTTFGGRARALDYDLESRGTQVLAALAIPVLEAIAAGHLVVVDELDSSLHHRLTEALLKLFKGATNHNGAQLIATVHDTTLLRDALKLDEVWLAEKDASGASRFTPLTDFRIRSREDLEKVYREGRVGGAPVIGDLAVALGA